MHKVIGLVFLLAPAHSLLDTLVPNHGHVTETLLQSADGYSKLQQLADIHNTKDASGKIVLRGEDGKGSRVHINKEISQDGWAVEISTNRLKLEDTQKAALLLWCTADELQPGEFMGGANKYKGFMAGIEFSKERLDLLLNYNIGLDYENPEVGMFRDHVNPASIADIKELTFKVVHTRKNFVIELYSSGKLISDSFRVGGHILPLENMDSVHLAVTTSYVKLPGDIAFELNSMAMYERIESEEYEPEEHHVAHNQFPKHESDKEVRQAIADLEHFMAYAHVVLGGENKDMIADMGTMLKELMKKQKDELDAMAATTKTVVNGPKSELADVNESKLQRLDERVAEITLKLDRLSETIWTNAQGAGRPVKEISNMLLAFTILITVLLVVKQLAWRYLISGVSDKKE